MTGPKCSRRSVLKGAGVSLALLGVGEAVTQLTAAEIATRYDYKPKLRNAWAHDPAAARWGGDVAANTAHWWVDTSTDQERVDNMLSQTLQSLTGADNDSSAWGKIFGYYNRRISGETRGYRPGEAVAVKVNRLMPILNERPRSCS